MKEIKIEMLDTVDSPVFIETKKTDARTIRSLTKPWTKSIIPRAGGVRRIDRLRKGQKYKVPEDQGKNLISIGHAKAVD